MARHVLVASASKHGSTLDIGDVIAGALSRRGFDVIDKPIDEVGTVSGFDAVVVGSAIYVGRWMPEAIAFTTAHATELTQIPVWLFSSGPIGKPPMPAGEPSNVAELMTKLGAREHRVFAGRLETDRLGLGEKLIVGMLRAPSGDFRDFGAIEAWANEIADALTVEDAPDTTQPADLAREALLAAARR